MRKRESAPSGCRPPSARASLPTSLPLLRRARDRSRFARDEGDFKVHVLDYSDVLATIEGEPASDLLVLPRLGTLRHCQHLHLRPTWRKRHELEARHPKSCSPYRLPLRSLLGADLPPLCLKAVIHCTVSA